MKLRKSITVVVRSMMKMRQWRDSRKGKHQGSHPGDQVSKDKVVLETTHSSKKKETVLYTDAS